MSVRSIKSWISTRSSSKSKSRRSWTRDPEKNKCDVTLQLKRKSGKRDTYYIHTKVLEALDKRRTPYFHKVFEEKAHIVGERASLLSASDEVADKFPLYLDFLYCRSKEEEQQILFNVQNGLDLYKIAEYYGITPLRDMLSKFYRDKTLAFSVVELINESKKFESEDTLESALKQFSQTMQDNESVDEKELEPTFLLRALKKRKELKVPMNRWHSENISCLVALCTQHFKKQLTRSMFYKLTLEEHIPFIDQEAALQLLTVEAEQGYWEDSDNFSSVQGRCIRSLLSDWIGLRNKFESDTAFWKTLRRLSPSILSIILMHATNTARGAEEIKDSGRAMAAEQRDDRSAISVRSMSNRVRIIAPHNMSASTV
jgi:hypothetical protein